MSPLKLSLLKPLACGTTVGLLLALLSACSPESLPQATLPSPSPAASASPQATKSQSTTDSPQPGGANSAAQPPTPASATPSNPKPQSQTEQAAPDSPIAIVKPTFWSKERMAGFSTDGSHFLYLESSRDTGAGIPKSKLQVVNVAANACKQEACITTRYSEADASLPTQAAEDSLLKRTWQVRQDLQLAPPVAGTELSIVARSRQPKGTEQVTVRLKNGDSVQLRLQQKRVVSTRYGGTADRDRAAMQLQVSWGERARSLDSLNNFRDDVLDYSIREVKLSPDGKRLAILLTATIPTFEGTLATTLVQGTEL